MRTIEEVEREFGQKVVAIVYNSDGTINDYCFTWETGQTIALEGYRVEAIADDGHVTKEQAQALYESEKERHDDCFGDS